jgi:transcriptional regulator with XRE-family HTH domain
MCKNVAVENAGDGWHARTAKRIGEAVARRRKYLGMTAQQLSERCAELQVPIHRTTITKIENGRPRFDLGELIVLSAALDVAPVALIYPHLPDGEVDRLPGDSATSAGASWWFTGEHDESSEPLPGDLNELLKLTRKRHKKVVQMEAIDDLLYELAKRGRAIEKSDFSLLEDLIDETRDIERRISQIQGSALSGGRRGESVPVESVDDV